MSALWRWVTGRHLLLEGGRTLLTILGVALGVAVFVAIRLANHSAMASFKATVNSVAGKSNLQITGGSTGIAEALLPVIRAAPGVQAAAPVVQTYARAAFGDAPEQRVMTRGEGKSAYDETLLVLGLDLFSESPFARFEEEVGESAAPAFVLDPQACAITRTLAERHGLEPGDPLHLITSGQRVTLIVRLIIESEELQHALGGSVVLCDLTVAQEAFGRSGKLDRIDLIVPEERREEIARSLAALLPPGVRTTRPQARTQQVENLVKAFELNLTALSFIALFVALFLIFNSISFSVLRRRQEIGILRGLGVTRSGILALFLGEGLALGVVGSALGLGVGTLMARGALGAVAETMSTLYLVVEARRLTPDLPTYAIGFALGVMTSLLSALAPAYEASRTPPGATIRQGMQIESAGVPLKGLSLAGAGLLALAVATVFWTVRRQEPIGGFFSAFFVLAGFSLLSPAWTAVCVRAADPVLRLTAGIEGVLGGRAVREALARAGVVVAALMVSVGMMVAMSTMVGSFRKTVDIWVSQTIRGDLYIEPVGRDVAGSASALPEQVIEIARKLPEVIAVDTFRAVEIAYRARIAHAVGIDFAVQERHGNLAFIGVTRERGREILREAKASGGILASESFAFRHRLRVGDTIELDTPAGLQSLRLAGIFYDYSTDAGAIYVDYSLYQRLWKEQRTESIALYVRPGAAVDDVRTAFIRALPPDIVLYVTPNQSLRRRVLRVFDQTFRITYALQAIAIMVAVLGVVSTLTALIMQRSREIGVLRAVGALRGQVRKMVLIESGLLGLFGSVLGCVCGIALSLLLIHVINKQFFGWSIRFHVDPWLFVQAIVLMVTASVLAGLGPARLAASRLAAEAMRAD